MEMFWERMIYTFQMLGFQFGVKPPGWTFREHHHHLCELMYCREGRVHVWIGNRKLAFGSGDWLFLKAGVRHRFENDSETNFSFFNMHFDIDDPDLRKMLNSTPFHHIAKEKADGTRLTERYRQIEQAVRDNQEQAASAADAHQKIRQLTGKVALQAHSLLLIREIAELRLDEQQAACGQETDVRSLSLFQTNIAHKIEQKLSAAVYSDTCISEISRDLHMSRNRCTKIFTQVYGISPRQYVSELKLKQAKELLLQTDVTVEEIARRLGFSSVHHFSRQFHRWTGMPPSRFRPKHTASPLV